MEFTITDEEFAELCSEHLDLLFEMQAEGGSTVPTPGLGFLSQSIQSPGRGLWPDSFSTYCRFGIPCSSLLSTQQTVTQPLQE